MLERGLGWLVIATSLTGSAGCSQLFGPEVFPTTSVKGTVTISGRPVGPGWIEFNPVDGAKGNLRTAPIRPDGSYSAERVPIGRVAVTLNNLHLPSTAKDLGTLPAGYYRFSDHPIQRDLPPGELTRLNLDLTAEASAYQQRRTELERMLKDPNE
jgi:hypothetical protein